ncbi:MAG: bifunctional molybdenum cofactor biosynthesis protein MoaC/MoaB [Candidatus Bipolaricaulia bacterium]
MRDVTDKPETRRHAVAEAFVATSADGVDLLQRGATEKGDALEVARVAGIMAAKNADDILPFCHPLPITHAEISYDVQDEGVRVEATTTCIGPTGVEMEALTAANVAALTIYDMLKPHTSEVEIRMTRLVDKSGGKNDYRDELDPPVQSAVLVLSDSVASGKKEDRAGKAVLDVLDGEPSVENSDYEIIPDDPEQLQTKLRGYVDEGIGLVLTVGGTGLAHTDLTVETVEPMLDREIPGIMEASRSYGQRRMPYAMLSRGVAGMIGDTLVVTLPGSTGGATESCQALFPALLHVFFVLRKLAHMQGYE